MLKHICLDMDGVLADFQKAALAVFGWRVDPDRGCADGALMRHEDGSTRKYPWGEWNIHHVLGISDDSFWSALHNPARNFFAHLEPTREAEALIGRLRRCGVPFTICTSPSNDARDATAKVEWMQNLLGDSRYRDYMIGPNKPLFAKPDVLLIDDSDKNILNFSAAGGQTLLWPQYWNANYRLQNSKLTVLENTLKKLGVA